MGGEAWRVSLHGGHSSDFCDHGRAPLRALLDAAVAAGYRAYGVTEHVPRLGERFLYPRERELGWGVGKLEALFEAYARALPGLVAEYRGRLEVLRGFEAEVVPEGSYAELMAGWRRRFGFEYVVASVHHVDELQIDGPPEEFERAMAARGGLEPLAVRYYGLVAEAAAALRPEVVGHLDVIAKNGHRYGDVATPAVRGAAAAALESLRAVGAAVECNVAGWRKGLPTPYPAPWLLEQARDLGLRFCFGDDAHGPEDVGWRLDDARAYLLEGGVRSVTVLRGVGDRVVREEAALR